MVAKYLEPYRGAAMDKNQFYLYNDVLYKLLSCTTLDSLKRAGSCAC